MFSFCPHCGQTLEQEQAEGQRLICRHCGKEIGTVRAAPAKVVLDGTEELIRAGKAARCPVCEQAVEVRAVGANRSFATHFTKTGPRKVCPGSGKPIASPEAAKKSTPAGKDLSAYMTRDVVKVVLCRKDAEPTIEELTLEYLDKADRVRLQIEALREILGTNFRMQDYPVALKQSDLLMWSSGDACVVARKHPQGGYQSMSEADIAQVLVDLRQAREQLL